MFKLDTEQLKTLKLYLPYVCIVVLVWANIQLVQHIVWLYSESKKDDRENLLFYKDAYLNTTEAYQKALRYGSQPVHSDTVRVSHDADERTEPER